MMNEELTQKNDALPEKELDGVSGGLLVVAGGEIGTEGVMCPNCGSHNTTPAPGGGYLCLACQVPFGQPQHPTRGIELLR